MVRQSHSYGFNPKPSYYEDMEDANELEGCWIEKYAFRFYCK